MSREGLFRAGAAGAGDLLTGYPAPVCPAVGALSQR
jgi:hypothetical protein